MPPQRDDSKIREGLTTEGITQTQILRVGAEFTLHLKNPKAYLNSPKEFTQILCLLHSHKLLMHTEENEENPRAYLDIFHQLNLKTRTLLGIGFMPPQRDDSKIGE